MGHLLTPHLAHSPVRLTFYRDGRPASRQRGVGERARWRLGGRGVGDRRHACAHAAGAAASGFASETRRRDVAALGARIWGAGGAVGGAAAGAARTDGGDGAGSSSRAGRLVAGRGRVGACTLAHCRATGAGAEVRGGHGASVRQGRSRRRPLRPRKPPALSGTPSLPTAPRSCSSPVWPSWAWTFPPSPAALPRPRRLARR